MWVTFLFILLFVMKLLQGTDVLLGSAITLVSFLKLLGFLVPHFLVMAAPVAFLLALLLGLGRLLDDRELLALGALGVGPLRILAVPLMLGAALGLFLFGLAASADPWGQASVKYVIAEVIKKNVLGDVKPGLFYEDLTRLTLYAEQVDTRAGQWHHVLISDDQDPREPLLVLAQEGTVDASGTGERLSIQLSRGQVHRAEQSGSDYTILTFKEGTLSVGVGDALFHKDKFRSPKDELTPGELLQAARESKARGEDNKPFLVAFHGRLAQGFTPLAFALLAGPLTLARRQARGASYFLALLGYVLYYVLARAFENWGVQGHVPPWLGGAGTNLVFAGLGAFLILRSSRQGVMR